MITFIKNFVQYHTLNKTSKYLLLLSVFSSIGQIIFGTFINVYIYQIFQGWEGVLWGTLFILTTTFLSFVVVGLLSRVYTINIKYIFMASMIAVGLSLFFMFFTSLPIILVGYLVYGIGNGLYYCALNTYELKKVEKENRGKYSGIMMSFLSLTKVIVPLIISGIFILCTHFSLNTYYILIPLGALISSLSLVWINKIPDEYIPRLAIQDVKHFFKREHFRGLSYISLKGIFGITGTIFTIISFYILQTEVKLGIYTALISLLTIIFMLYIGKKIKNTNRVFYLGLLSVFMCGIYIFYANHLSVFGFIIASINNVLLLQIYFILDKVNNMYVLENLQSKSKNVFGPIVSAEALIYITRFSALAFLIYFVDKPSTTIMQYALYLIALFILLAWVCLYMWERRKR